jgi:hypothetical protein
VGFKELTGILSRYFIVGFYVPSFVVLLLYAESVRATWLPAVYGELDDGTQIIVIGAVAVVVGLALSGLHYPLLRAYEGYPIYRWRAHPLGRPLYDLMTRRKRKAFEELERRVTSPEQSPERSAAGDRLDKVFPLREDLILPTRFGNAVRAMESHSYRRYGLDGVAVWPRLERLLSPEERELHVNAECNLAFFVNLSAGSATLGGALLLDAVIPGGGGGVLGGLIALALAACFYAAAVGAAKRWGTEVRSSIDIHRLGLYDSLGIPHPTTEAEERTVARHINRLLIYGVPLPDATRVGAASPGDEAPAGLPRLAKR